MQHVKADGALAIIQALKPRGNLMLPSASIYITFKRYKGNL